MHSLCIAALLACCAPQARDFGTDLEAALIDGDTAYIFLKPMMVAEGDYLQAKWSDDGRYLLLATERQILNPSDFKREFERGHPAVLQSEVTISVADMARGRAKALWTSVTPKGARASLQFFENSDVAVVVVETGDKKAQVLRVTLGTALTELVETLEGPGKVSIGGSQSLMAVTAETPPSVRFIGSKGQVFRRQPLSQPSTVSFTLSGSAVVNAAKAPGRHLTIEPGGEEVWADGLPKFQVSDEEFGLQRMEIETSTIELPGSRGDVDIVVARIAGGEKTVVLALNAVSSFYRHDREQGVLYSTENLQMARPVVKVSRAAYEQIAGQEQRAKLIADLTAIGKSLASFKRNRGRFPAKDEFGRFVEDLADHEVARGFTYFGETESSPNPSTFEVGFSLCRGGRIVLYQDGHAAFVAEQVG